MYAALVGEWLLIAGLVPVNSAVSQSFSAACASIPHPR